ncbi:MAG: hypothetical protein LBH54_00215 [Clostridiales bacterium]|jgi:hypothetical protein|nr:hypothetical protein [Clostridiales bacterium]
MIALALPLGGVVADDAPQTAAGVSLNAAPLPTDVLPTGLAEKIRAHIPALAGFDAHNAHSDGNGRYSIEFQSRAGAFAQVVSDGGGVIFDYFMNPAVHDAEQGKRLPAVSKTRAAEIAVNFARNAAADIFSRLNTRSYTNTYSNDVPSGYAIRFTRSEYGISYAANSVSVWVDAQTGGVTRYSRVWEDGIQFAPAREIVPQTQAEEFFKENIGLSLRYHKKTENGKAAPYLVYVPSNTGSLDAVSGGAVNGRPAPQSENYREQLALYESAAISAAPARGGATEPENLVSGNEAQRYIRKLPELNISGDYSAEQAKYYRDPNGEVLITVTFTKDARTASVTLNARTLALIGFMNDSTREPTAEPPVDAATASATANNFLKKYMNGYTPGLAPPVTETRDGVVYMLFERVVSGVPYKSNSIQFVINPRGEIISMSSVWDDAPFPDPTDVINRNAAYEIFFNQIGLHLMYTRTSDDTANLVYMVNPQVPAIIDASSGVILTYNGAPAKPKTSLSYIGLRGHYAEKHATILADCDVFVSEGNVLLDGDIPQKDYIVLLASVSPNAIPAASVKIGGVTDEDTAMIYNAFVTEGVLTAAEVQPGSGVTREDAVKYLLRVVGYKNVAELQDIFKMPFADAQEIRRPLYGYVALARGLRLVSGSDGYFYPRRYLTNADALVMIYNYLNRGARK